MPSSPTKTAAKAKPAAAAKQPAKPKDKPAAAAKRAPAKAVAKPAAPKANPDKARAFRLKDLVEAVVAATEMKKPDAKRAIEATLATLASALKRGDDLNLPPLGRARVAKTADKDGASTLTLKLRLGGSAKPGAKQPLADAGEED